MIPTTEMIPAVTTEMIPGIAGMEWRGLQKLDNNLARAFYLFILHLFYGVYFTFHRALFCSKFFFGLTLDNTCSKDAIHLCLLVLRIFFEYIFLQDNFLNKIVLKQNKSNL